MWCANVRASQQSPRLSQLCSNKSNQGRKVAGFLCRCSSPPDLLIDSYRLISDHISREEWIDWGEWRSIFRHTQIFGSFKQGQPWCDSRCRLVGWLASAGGSCTLFIDPSLLVNIPVFVGWQELLLRKPLLFHPNSRGIPVGLYSFFMLVHVNWLNRDHEHLWTTSGNMHEYA